MESAKTIEYLNNSYMNTHKQLDFTNVSDDILDSLIADLGLKKSHTLPDPCCFICRENIRYAMRVAEDHGVRHNRQQSPQAVVDRWNAAVVTQPTTTRIDACPTIWCSAVGKRLQLNQTWRRLVLPDNILARSIVLGALTKNIINNAEAFPSKRNRNDHQSVKANLCANNRRQIDLTLFLYTSPFSNQPINYTYIVVSRSRVFS